MRDLDGEGAGVDELVRGRWPARGQPVTLRTTSPQAPLGERPIGGEGVDDFDEAGEGEPVELDVLAGGDVGEVAGVLLGELADDAGLMRGEQAVGHADAHHEVLGGFAFAVGAAGDAEAVALGVDAPPLEVEIGPLGRHGVAAVAGVLADLVPGLPGVLGELEALGALGLGFFGAAAGRWWRRRSSGRRIL